VIGALLAEVEFITVPTGFWSPSGWELALLIAGGVLTVAVAVVFILVMIRRNDS
jgi:hypothetical protein